MAAYTLSPLISEQFNIKTSTEIKLLLWGTYDVFKFKFSSQSSKDKHVKPNRKVKLFKWDILLLADSWFSDKLGS
jgi:hypothetical protein